ncbi:hypothetical protein ACET67_20395, partial [Aeromonas veronii]
KRSLFSKKKCTKKIYLSLNKRHLEKRPLSQPFKIAGFRNLALQLPICSIDQRGQQPIAAQQVLDGYGKPNETAEASL